MESCVACFTCVVICFPAQTYDLLFFFSSFLEHAVRLGGSAVVLSPGCYATKGIYFRIVDVEALGFYALLVVPLEGSCR